MFGESGQNGTNAQKHVGMERGNLLEESKQEPNMEEKNAREMQEKLNPVTLYLVQVTYYYKNYLT